MNDNNWDWIKQAICRTDPDLYSSPKAGDKATAAHMCKAHCPVQEQCEQDAFGAKPVSVTQAGYWWEGNYHGHGRAETIAAYDHGAYCGHQPPKPPHGAAPCGTLAGVARHRRNNEPICDQCATAERDHDRDRRALTRHRARVVTYQQRRPPRTRTTAAARPLARTR